MRKFLLAARCSSCSTNYASDIPAASRFVLHAACWRLLLRSTLAASSLRSRSAWIFGLSAREHVVRCHVANRPVQSQVVIAIHILLDQAFRFFQ